MTFFGNRQNRGYKASTPMGGKFFNYLENDAELLVRKIKTADLVVGFNVAKFDYGQGYFMPMGGDRQG
jgi:hypothetical protein